MSTTKAPVSPTARRNLFGVVILLLVFLAIRLHNLDRLPLFIDESIFIDSAQQTREGHVLGIAVANGRLLHVWYNAFLGPYLPAAGWVARAGMVIASLLGVSAFYALARRMISARAGFLAAIVWTTAPYLLFYERISVADTMLNATGLPMVLLAWHLTRHPSRKAAAALGFALTVVLLAKVTGLVWLPLPLVAVLLARSIDWRERLRLAAITYGVFGALWGPFLAFLRWKNYDYLGLRSQLVGGVNDSLWERTWQNIELVWRVDTAYLGLPFVIVAIAGGIVWFRFKPRSALFALLMLGMIGGGSLMFGTGVNSRRVLGHVPWIILPAVAGFELLLYRRPRWTPVIYLGLGLWLLFVFRPFLVDAWYSPHNLALYRDDRGEYIMYDSAGYGVTEIGHRLRAERPSQPVIGLVANCLTLRYAAYPVPVMCPTIRWDGTSQDELMALVEQSAAEGSVLVVGENLAYINLSELPQPHTELTRVERPGGRLPVMLVLVEQGARRPPAN